MRTVSFKSVLDSVGRRAGLDVADTTNSWTATIQGNVAEFISAWVRKGWEWEFWPELTVLELRQYRDAYSSATAYAAPTSTAAVEVWFPDAQKYYQALQATTNHAPATLVAGVWTANGPYWAECFSSYAGNDWAASTVYTAATASAAGTIVRNQADNRMYMCITSHTSGSTFDATKFGVLTTFERYISLDQTGKTAIGEVRRVSRSNPRTNPRFPGEVTFVMDDKGILPAPNAGDQVWVEFRLRPSVFTITAYNAGTSYAVGDPVYSSGESYLSLSAANIAHTPESSPTYWKKQDLPYVIADFVKWAAYGDLLRTGGDSSRAAAAEQEAFNQLSQASDVALASQGQYERATAAVY